MDQTPLSLLLDQVRDNPDDTILRLDLSKCLISMNKHKEAISHLQKARSNPHIREEVDNLCEIVLATIDGPSDDDIPPQTGVVVPSDPLGPSGNGVAETFLEEEPDGSQQ